MSELPFLIFGHPIPETPLPQLSGAAVKTVIQYEGEPPNDRRTTVWKLRCPVCGVWGEIDDDQLHGRVSIDHTDFVRLKSDDPPEGFRCTFHETHDLWTMFEERASQ